MTNAIPCGPGPCPNVFRPRVGPPPARWSGDPESRTWPPPCWPMLAKAMSVGTSPLIRLVVQGAVCMDCPLIHRACLSYSGGVLIAGARLGRGAGVQLGEPGPIQKFARKEATKKRRTKFWIGPGAWRPGCAEDPPSDHGASERQTAKNLPVIRAFSTGMRHDVICAVWSSRKPRPARVVRAPR